MLKYAGYTLEKCLEKERIINLVIRVDKKINVDKIIEMLSPDSKY